MATTAYDLPSSNAWVELAADITAVTLFQVVPVQTPEKALATLVAAASAPAADAIGVMVQAGDTLDADDLALVGASDKLYGRSVVKWAKVAVTT